MKIDREPDNVIEHQPIQCAGCPHTGTCKLQCCETRYEYEAVVETRLTAHKVLGCKACALTGEATQGARHITGAKQYGPGVAGLAVSLLIVGYMSVDRVQKLLKSLRIPVRNGVIQDMMNKASKLVETPVEHIARQCHSCRSPTTTKPSGVSQESCIGCTAPVMSSSVITPYSRGTARRTSRIWVHCPMPAAWQCMILGSFTGNTATSTKACAAHTWNVN